MQQKYFDFNTEHTLKGKYTCNMRAMGNVTAGQNVLCCTSDILFSIEKLDEDTIKEMIAKKSALFTEIAKENLQKTLPK